MLPDYIEDAERIARLEGNVGRKVMRQLDQLFPGGLFTVTYVSDAVVNLVDAALFARRMTSALEMARVRIEHLKDRLHFEVSAKPVQGLALYGCEVTVQARLTKVPAAMKDRQDVLDAFAAAMRCFVVMAAMTDTATLARAHQEHLEGLPDEGRGPQLRYFEELVEGDYRHIAETNGRYLTLAIALNPAVEEQVRDLYRQEDLADAA